MALTKRALPVIWPGFEVTPNSERSPVLVEVVPYDQRWPEQFREWQRRLSETLGPTALRVDHVGSTSIPGLGAKPIIDMQLSVRDIEDESAYVTHIEATGLQLRSRDVEHRFFRPFADRPLDAQLHVCNAGGHWESVHILFRDFLREHPDATARYLAVKVEEAHRWRDDRIAYAEAKTGIVLALLGAAEQWAAETGWSLPPATYDVGGGGRGSESSSSSSTSISSRSSSDP